MAFVLKGNTMLEVNEESVERMLDDGYDLVDAYGNIITKSIPKDINTLRTLYLNSIAEVEKLKAEIAQLKNTTASAEAKEESVTKVRKSARK